MAGFHTRMRRFRHPDDGLLIFEYQQFVVAGEPDLRLVVQLPVS